MENLQSISRYQFQPGDLVQWESVKNDCQVDFDIDIGIVVDVNDNLMTSPRVLILWESGDTSWMDIKGLSLINSAR
jgi:hypothetical protein